MREALALLTVLGGPASPTPRALRWFPVVGAVVGAIVGGCWWLAGQAFPALLAAAIAVVADLAITGLLHVDGLADASDGLLPHATRNRRLAIMRAPDVGAFGIAAVGAVLLLRTGALAGQSADVGLVAGLWCASRTIAAVAPAWVPYAREEGLASPLLTAPVLRWPLLALLPALGLAVVGRGAAGGVAVAVAALASVGVFALARVRIGGFTGDVMGAAIVVGETVGLVIAAARW